MHVLNPLLFPVLSAVAVVAYAPYKHFPSFLEISTIALFQLHFGKGEVHYKEAPNETVSGELCPGGLPVVWEGWERLLHLVSPKIVP